MGVLQNDATRSLFMNMSNSANVGAVIDRPPVIKSALQLVRGRQPESICIFFFLSERRKYRKPPVCALVSADVHRTSAFRWVRFRAKPKRSRPIRVGIFLVPATGIEPVRFLRRGILSPLCLPIPPCRHRFVIVTQFSLFVKKKPSQNIPQPGKEQGFVLAGVVV